MRRGGLEHNGAALQKEVNTVAFQEQLELWFSASATAPLNIVIEHKTEIQAKQAKMS